MAPLAPKGAVARRGHMAVWALQDRRYDAERVHDALFQTSDVSAGCERPSWSDWPERPTRNHSKCIPYYIPPAMYLQDLGSLTLMSDVTY